MSTRSRKVAEQHQTSPLPPHAGEKKKHSRKQSHARFKRDAALRLTEMSQNASPKTRASRPSGNPI